MGLDALDLGFEKIIESLNHGCHNPWLMGAGTAHCRLTLCSLVDFPADRLDSVLRFASINKCNDHFTRRSSVLLQNTLMPCAISRWLASVLDLFAFQLLESIAIHTLFVAQTPGELLVLVLPVNN